MGKHPRVSDRGFTPHITSLKLCTGFTLIELLVVIAILGAIAVAVVLVINPAELLKQARDSTRLWDLATINRILGLLQADQVDAFMGTSSIVYVSLPDTTSTCANLSLPTLPSGWTYNCAPTSTLQRVDGTGWIPVNFTAFSAGSPLSRLPVDPVNTTSTGNYYTYVTGGSWELTAIPESQKQRSFYKTNPFIQNIPGVIAYGSNLSLSPLFNTQGLVGYWTFNEGSGTTVGDQSGNGNTGTWNGSGSHWGSGKVDAYAGQFNGSSDYVQVSDSSSLDPASGITIAAWVKPTSGGWRYIISKNLDSQYMFRFDYTAPAALQFVVNSGAPGDWFISQSRFQTNGTWYHVVGTYTNGSIRIYRDGVLDISRSKSGSIANTNASLTIGNGFPGSIDDIRIYNRALSAAEVSAIYNATK